MKYAPSRADDRRKRRNLRRLTVALVLVLVLGAAAAAMVFVSNLNDNARQGVDASAPSSSSLPTGRSTGHRPLPTLTPAAPTTPRALPSGVAGPTRGGRVGLPTVTVAPRPAQGPRSVTTRTYETTLPGTTATVTVTETQPRATETVTVTATRTVSCADPQVECACDHSVVFDCDGNPRVEPEPEGLPE